MNNAPPPSPSAPVNNSGCQYFLVKSSEEYRRHSVQPATSLRLKAVCCSNSTYIGTSAAGNCTSLKRSGRRLRAVRFIGGFLCGHTDGQMEI